MNDPVVTEMENATQLAFFYTHSARLAVIAEKKAIINPIKTKHSLMNGAAHGTRLLN